MLSNWKRKNEALTRNLIDKINKLPQPIKFAIGFLPGGGAATSYADIHRWSVLKLAKHYEAEGKLTKEASSALHAYETKLLAEQQAHERLLSVLAKII
jgi:hypothetical protein